MGCKLLTPEDHWQTHGGHSGMKHQMVSSCHPHFIRQNWSGARQSRTCRRLGLWGTKLKSRPSLELRSTRSPATRDPKALRSARPNCSRKYCEGWWLSLVIFGYFHFWGTRTLKWTFLANKASLPLKSVLWENIPNNFKMGPCQNKLKRNKKKPRLECRHVW